CRAIRRGSTLRGSSMDKKRVLEALDVLRVELTDAEHLDGDARQALERVTGDIQRLLANENPSSSGDTLAKRLEHAWLDFEAEHPKLTQAVNQLANALANLGI